MRNHKLVRKQVVASKYRCTCLVGVAVSIHSHDEVGNEATIDCPGLIACKHRQLAQVSSGMSTITALIELDIAAGGRAGQITQQAKDGLCTAQKSAMAGDNTSHGLQLSAF